MRNILYILVFAEQQLESGKLMLARLRVGRVSSSVQCMHKLAHIQMYMFEPARDSSKSSQIYREIG